MFKVSDEEILDIFNLVKDINIETFNYINNNILVKNIKYEDNINRLKQFKFIHVLNENHRNQYITNIGCLEFCNIVMRSIKSIKLDYNYDNFVEFIYKLEELRANEKRRCHYNSNYDLTISNNIKKYLNYIFGMVNNDNSDLRCSTINFQDIIVSYSNNIVASTINKYIEYTDVIYIDADTVYFQYKKELNIPNTNFVRYHAGLFLSQKNYLLWKNNTTITKHGNIKIL